MRRISKSHARAEAGFGGIEMRECALRKGNILTPQCGGSVALALCGQVIEQVCRLTVIGPGEAQIQGEVLADLPVIAGIEEGVMLAEIQCRRSGGNAHAVRCIGSEGLPIAKAESAVEVGQERVGRALIGIVHARFESVLAHDPVEIVLCLPGIHDAAFRKRTAQSKRQEAWIIECGAADSLVQTVV